MSTLGLNNPRIPDAKTPRKTHTMKRVVVQQYVGYQVVVGVYIMRGCRD